MTRASGARDPAAASSYSSYHLLLEAGRPSDLVVAIGFCIRCGSLIDLLKSVQDFKQILEEFYTNPEASTSALARMMGTSESYVGRIKREAGLT